MQILKSEAQVFLLKHRNIVMHLNQNALYITTQSLSNFLNEFTKSPVEKLIIFKIKKFELNTKMLNTYYKLCLSFRCLK